MSEFVDPRLVETPEDGNKGNKWVEMMEGY
jgi:hypothetical protein